MRHGSWHRRGSTAAAGLRILLGLLCAVSLICAGDGFAGSPASVQRPQETVTGKPPEVASLPLPRPLSDVLSLPVKVPGG
jgi:hypothetical protein